MFWDKQLSVEAASLQIVGKRFNFETGEIHDESFSLNLLEENSIVEFSEKVMVKEEVAISSIQREFRHNWSLSTYTGYLSTSKVKSKFPVAAINIMSNLYNLPWRMNIDHHCLYLKSLDYEKLSQN